MRACLPAVMTIAACTGPAPATPGRCDPPTGARAEFRGTRAPKFGDPRHASPDLVVAVGEPFTIRGKFAYGKIRKDLEDEDVSLFLGEGTCGPWDGEVIASTDDDGFARFAHPGFDRPVVRPFHLIVRGDGTRTTGTIWVVGPGTPAVLFDIDGTLTTGDSELLEDLLGDGAPDVRAGAADVARRWAELGYLVVYITGRMPSLRRTTLGWLDAHGFPPGPVLNPDDARDVIPSRDRVGAYKRGVISGMIADGVVFEAAYGNAATDVCAYAEAGIPPDRTWITQPRAACDAFAAPHDLPSYVDHLPTLRDHPRAPE